MSQVTPSRPSPVRRERSREVKRATVISAARSARTLSRIELAETTGLSPATLTPLVRELLSEGYLVERGAEEASRTGRPRTILEFNPRVELVAAVSLAPTGISCQIADSHGEVIAEERRGLAGDVVELVTTIVRDLVADDGAHLRGVAVAVPGVSFQGKVRLAPAVGLVEIRSVGEQVAKQLDVPVVVDNDVNLMAVGEHSAGAAQGCEDVMLFHFAEGVGAGLILDGRIRRGASGAAGEVGFFPTGAVIGTQRGVGDFEAAWSVDAIAQVVRRHGYDLSGTTPIAALLRAAGEDAQVAEYRDTVLNAWARLIFACICVVDPGLVLLSGAATDLDQAALEQLEALVQRGAPSSTSVRLAELGERSVLLGAITSALTAAGLLARPVVSN